MSDTITEVPVVARTFVRDDETGRFIEAVNSGASKAVSELADTLLALVKAAIAAMFRERTGDLLSKAHVRRTGLQSAEVEDTSGHAAPLDEGSRDHPIPNAFGSGVTVMWTGDGKGSKSGGRAKTGFHFMREAEKALNTLAGDIVRRNLP